VAQLFVGLTVVSEYAEYEACETTRPETATAAGMAARETSLASRRDERPVVAVVAVVCMRSS
jgi:hypothetical protein